MRYTTLLLFLLMTVLVQAQLDFHRSNEIPVTSNGIALDHAWAGGLNSSQWSTIDLNIDGVEDLFIFDRSSEQIQTYLKDPVTGLYSLTFDYADNLPEVRDWVLLRDFNCDNKKDVFTYTPGGIRVYENVSANGVLEFELKSLLLDSYYDFGVDPYYSNLYVSNQDIPSIDDFDGDGDLDIHTFTLAGLTIEYHKNFAVEIGNCDSLAFELRNRCYGMIGEDAVSPTVYIGQEFIDGEFCTFNVIDPKMSTDDAKDGAHSGSSICSFDYDGNGQRDLLLGDITARDMSLIYIDDRGVLVDSAFAIENDFPEDDVSVDMHVFHAAYFEDLDNDGIRDLMITPSNGTESEDRSSCWFYKNTGSNDDVDLVLQTSSFLQESMLDNGTVSFPRVFDYNSDGLPDILLTNRGKYQDGGVFQETFWLLENVGNPNYPIYDLVTENFMGLNDIGLGDHLVPAFGDLDNDGDIDMFIGDGGGKLHYFENSAGAGNDVQFSTYVSLLNDGGGLLDIGASLVPQLFDLDDDGLLDLLVGERNGNTNFLQNIGTVDEFEFVLIEDTIGDIVTDLDANLIGYSAPWFTRDEDGQVDVFFGTETGELFYCQDISTDPFQTWTITDSMAFGVFNGKRSCPVLVDLDDDDQLDILNGNRSGGIGLYMGGSEPSSLPENLAESLFDLYPNPAETELIIQLGSECILNAFEVFDVSGRSILINRNINVDRLTVDIDRLAPGVYIIAVDTSRGQASRRFLKK